MACVIMIVDLFLPAQRRGIIHGLAMLTVIFAAIITLRHEYLVGGVQSVTAFEGSFIRDAMGDVLKVFAFVLMGLIYIYSKFYLRNFKMFRLGLLFVEPVRTARSHVADLGQFDADDLPGPGTDFPVGLRIGRIQP